MSRRNYRNPSRSAGTLAALLSPAAGAPPIVTYATWNPSDKDATITLSNGNLTASHASFQGSVRSTISKDAGNWYWEIAATVIGDGLAVGIALASENISNLPGDTTASWAYQLWSGLIVHNGNIIDTVDVCQDGDVIGIALNPAGLLTFYRNGVQQGAALDIAADTWFAASGHAGGVGEWTANFGASAFAESVPPGYNAGLYT
jgi:hypothetical protein